LSSTDDIKGRLAYHYEEKKKIALRAAEQEKKIEVAELSAHLGVSQVTVRKDLDAMEAQGLITREHGFAVLSSTDDIKGRLAYHYEEKKRSRCARQSW
jgi:DeoR/GlpR family transcriptional regulator of sugar metabolism